MKHTVSILIISLHADSCVYKTNRHYKLSNYINQTAVR